MYKILTKKLWPKQEVIAKILLIMRLTTIILITAILQVSASSFAQKITLTEKNAPLVTVFDKISAQSGFDFLISASILKDSKPVSINVRNMELSEVLQQLFEGRPLSYSIENKSVVERKKELSFLENIIARFQAKEIVGKVVNEEDVPMPDATIKIKNTNQSTVANEDGEFVLRGVPEDAIIVVSYIGYTNSEIPAELFKPYLRVSLIKSESKLDEVQVMAYGLTSRRLSTGNISTVKADDVDKQDVSNPLLALQGRVAGLIVTPSSGVPGAPLSVRIRGVNTLGNVSQFNKTAEPLFVIDGIPYANNIPVGSNGAAQVNGEMSAFSFINPSDIESIDVLKDADATAIYGSRGANGVILITTKKGRIGSNIISVNLSTSYGEVPRKIDLLNTQQYLEMRKEAYKNDGLALPKNPAFNNYDLTVWDQNRYTDWQENMLGGTAKYTNAQASISGGGLTVQYMISGNYNQQGYVFPGDAKNESGNGHFSISGNSLNNKFRAVLTGTYTANKSLSSTDFTTLTMQLAPNAPAIYTADGSLNWEPDPKKGIGTWSNPYARLLLAATTKTNLINSSADLSYKLLPSLTIRTNFGFSELRGNTFVPGPMAASDPFYVSAGAILGTSIFVSNFSRSWSFEPQALYHFTIGRGNLDAIAGATYQYQNRELQQIYASGFQSDALLGDLGSADSYFADNSLSEYKYMGFFSRLTYNWEDKYIINLNLRRDGSSRFGPKQQYGNFGSIGAAWNFGNEAFLISALPFMSFGKLRFSYGVSGNDGIGDYKYLELYGSLGDIGNPTYRGGQGLLSGGVTNPYYHWEETYKGEIGLETGFFGDQILFSTSYFRNRSSDQLGSFPLASTAGISNNFVVNRDAKIQASGLEFVLSTRNLKGKVFTWSTSANLSVERNKLLGLPAEGLQAYGLDFATKVGDPYAGVSYLYDFKGVDPVTGRYQFLEEDGTLTFSPRYRSAKTTDPKFYGGLSNTFSFKGFRLDIFMQFTKQFGRNYLFDVFSSSFKYPGSFSSDRGNMPIEVLARWQKTGDISSVQRFTTKISGDMANSWNSAAFSNISYVDASFIRLKNVSVSYAIPETWNEKIGFKNLSIYLRGQNLWTITNYKGLDPETQGISLPQLKVITAGIQAGF